MTCHGLNHGSPCTCTVLIKAHIMPRGFARDMMKGGTHNVQLSMTNTKTTQHGIYDPEILCATCDGILGKYDDYAIEVSRKFNLERTIDVDIFKLSNVDGDQFAKFVLAVLWRASISTRPEFKNVNLGPYEAIAQEVLFGTRLLSQMCGFEVMLFRYRQTPDLNVEGVYSLPGRFENVGINVWGFAACGFRIMAKMDKRSWPNIPSGEIKHVVVNGSKELVGLYVDFKESPEDRATLAMATAHWRRHKPK